MNKIQQHGERILAGIRDIRSKMEETRKWLADLEMQARVMAQGVDAAEVLHYGYDPLLDTRWKLIGKRPRVYNFVIMKDGRRIDIQSVVVPPEK